MKSIHKRPGLNSLLPHPSPSAVDNIHLLLIAHGFVSTAPQSLLFFSNVCVKIQTYRLNPLTVRSAAELCIFRRNVTGISMTCKLGTSQKYLSEIPCLWFEETGLGGAAWHAGSRPPS